MPHPSAPQDRADAAVAQVLIARTREQLCEACATASTLPSPAAVSARVDGTDLFVITPDATDLSSVGPSQTSVFGIDGRIVSAPWDRRTAPSSASSEHAGIHRAGAGRSAASCAGRIVHAPTPAAALRAIAEPAGSPPADRAHPGSRTSLPSGKVGETHHTTDPHHTRSTQ